jgi:hypothetical protein
MQIVKKLTFSDVGAGAITVGSLTTNCPTRIRASVGILTSFNTSVVPAKLTFTDSASNVFSILTNIISGSNPNGYEFSFIHSGATGNGDLIGIYTELDGTIQVELDNDSGVPTQGACTIMIDIEALPIF